jgi:hypothetical protein
MLTGIAPWNITICAVNTTAAASTAGFAARHRSCSSNASFSDCAIDALTSTIIEQPRAHLFQLAERLVDWDQRLILWRTASETRPHHRRTTAHRAPVKCSASASTRYPMTRSATA